MPIRNLAACCEPIPWQEDHPVVHFLNHALRRHALLLDLPTIRQLSHFQVVTAFQTLRNHGLIACWDVGLGKTFLSVLAAALALWTGMAERVVFVATKTLKNNFVEALQEIGWTHLVEALGLADRPHRIVKEAGMTGPAHEIVTIDELKKRFGGILSISRQERITSRSEAAQLFRGAFVVVDEAHNFRSYPKGAAAVKTTLLMKLAVLSRQRLLLTATPIVNKPLDLVTLAAIAGGDLEIASEDYMDSMLQDPEQKGSMVVRNGRLLQTFGGLVTFLSSQHPKALAPCASALVESDPTRLASFPRANRVGVQLKLDAEASLRYRQEIARIELASMEENGKSRNAFYNSEVCNCNFLIIC